MSSSKNLDDLFKDKLNSQNFEPSESSWQNMENMLTNEEMDSFFRSKLTHREFKVSKRAWRRAAAMLPGETTPMWKRPLVAAASLALVLATSVTVYLNQPTENIQYSERNSAGINQLVEMEKELTFTNNNSNTIASDNTITPNNSQKPTNPKTTSQALAATAAALNNTANHESVSTTSKSSKKQNSLIAAIEDKATKISNTLQSITGKTQTETPLRLSQLSLSDIGSSELSQVALNEDDFDISGLKDFKKPKAVIKHQIGLIGGFNLAEGYSSGAYADSYSGNVFGGITYTHAINPNLFLESDLIYQARNGVGTTKTEESISYDFGYERQVATTENQTLHYLELPVLFGIRKGNLQIAAGPSLAYLMTSKNQQTLEYQSSLGDWTETKVSHGKSGGINSFDLALCASVEYEVLSKLGVGLRMNYGLTDVTNDSYFANNASDHNIQYRAFLSYKLFKF